MCLIFFSANFKVEQTNTADGISSDLVQGFVHSVNVDINELTNQNKCIDLQHTFRPIFVQFFKTNLYHRYKAVTFRRVLAEKGFDLKSLEDIWNEKKKVCDMLFLKKILKNYLKTVYDIQIFWSFDVNFVLVVRLFICLIQYLLTFVCIGWFN